MSAYIYNVINYKNMLSFDLKANGFKFFTNTLKQFNLNKNDYILYPNNPDCLMKYFNSASFIGLNYLNILYIEKTKLECLKMFNADFVFNTNRSNSAKNLMPYFMSSSPTPELT